MTKIKILGVVILSVLFFINCSNSDIDKTKIDEKLISVNLKAFSEEYIKMSDEINIEFSKNSLVRLNQDNINSLNSARNENDVSIALKKGGAKNSIGIISLLKKRILLQNDFRNKNFDYYKLTVQRRKELLDKEYDNALENYINKESEKLKLNGSTLKGVLPPCGYAYNTTISRCNRDYGKCGIVAVIAAAEGIVPGLVVGVFCAWDLSDCKADAQADYQNCKN
jgi:hypothetical protein